MKHHACTGGKICGSHRQRNQQFFECLDLQNAAEKLDHAFVAGKSITRERPAGEVFEAHPGGDLLQLGDGDAAAVGRADERPHTGARDQADGNIFFFEDFQNADMGDAASKAPTQRKSDTRGTLGRRRRRRKARQASSEGLYGTNDFV